MIGVGPFGVEPDRFGEIGNSAVEIALFTVRIAAIIKVIVPGLFGVDPDRLCVIGDGAVVVAFGGIGEATTVIGVGVFGVEPDRFGEIGDGAVVVGLGVFARDSCFPLIYHKAGAGAFMLAFEEIGGAAVVVSHGAVSRAFAPVIDDVRAAGDLRIALSLGACLQVLLAGGLRRRQGEGR